MAKYRIKKYKSPSHRYWWHVAQVKRFGIWWSLISTDCIDFSECRERLCSRLNGDKDKSEYYEVNCDDTV